MYKESVIVFQKLSTLKKFFKNISEQLYTLDVCFVIVN